MGTLISMLGVGWGGGRVGWEGTVKIAEQAKQDIRAKTNDKPQQQISAKVFPLKIIFQITVNCQCNIVY